MRAHRKRRKNLPKLAEIVEQTEDTPEEEPAGEEQEVISPLERYAELFAMNNDMAGWIQIEDTPINYPVMYTPDNPDYYLKHNFYKESSAYGVPYIAEHCDPMEPSDNVIIYGHHMNNGSMFAGLMNYEDRDFYERHKTVRFDTLTETAEYEVIAVFKTTVYGRYRIQVLSLFLMQRRKKSSRTMWSSAGNLPFMIRE